MARAGIVDAPFEPLDFSPDMKTPWIVPLLALAAAFAAPPARAAAPPPAKSAAPASERPAIDGVLKAFAHSDIVTLGERPWSRLDSDFRDALIADRRFADVVDDIVVEFANARYQPLIDRYVLDIALVPRDSLRKVWEDSSVPGAWDSPVYSFLLDAVRRVNQFRPRDRRVRVLAGDPPIDWSQVTSAADLQSFGARGAYVLDVIDREVIAKKHKALIVYGARNFFRRDRGTIADGNITTILEQRHPDLRVFVVGTVPDRSPAQARLDSTLTLPARPVLVRLADSRIGTWPTSTIYPFGDGMLSEMADALLYFGHVDDDLVRPSDRITRDVVYRKEVERRKALLDR